MTLRTAARGVVDYAQADLQDATWWRRWRYLVRAMNADDHVKLLERAFNFQLALVSHGNLGSDNFKAVQNEAKDIFEDIEGEVRPWLGKRTREERSAAEREEFAQLWEETAGFALDDKEAVAAWEQRVAGHVSDSVKTVEAAEAGQAERRQRFDERLEEIRQKRIRQQGR